MKNSRLRRAISDLTLDKLVLVEAVRENFRARAPPCLCVKCCCRSLVSASTVRAGFSACIVPCSARFQPHQVMKRL